MGAYYDRFKDFLNTPVSVLEWHIAFIVTVIGTAIPYLVTLLIVKTPLYELNPVVSYVIFELGWVAAAVYDYGLVFLILLVAWWAEGKQLWMGVRAAIWPFALSKIYNTFVDLRALLVIGIQTTPEDHNRTIAIGSLLVMICITVLIYVYWFRNVRTDPYARSRV